MNEIDLLMACCRTDSPPDSLGGLTSKENQSSLIELARFHKVEPLLIRCAKRLALLSDLPNAARNLGLTADLISIVQTFQSQGIDVLPHKGPLLALAAYRDLSLRSFIDLDLLVRTQDVSRALVVLETLGYRRAERLAWVDPQTLVRWTGETALHSPDGTSVDLHWRLTPPHYPVQLDASLLWPFQTVIRLAGTDLPTLAPEALLLVLAVHGAKHCWEAIGWLADVAWLAADFSDSQWRASVELAQRSRCERPLYLAASLAHRVMGTALPQFVQRSIQADSRIPRLESHVLDRWYRRAPKSPDSRELLRFASLLARNPWETLKHIEGLVFWPTEAEWSRGESAGPLQRARRALRLLGKHVSGR